MQSFIASHNLKGAASKQDRLRDKQQQAREREKET